MTTRGLAGVAAAALLAAWTTAAGAEPKPTAVDIKPFKANLIVLADAQGGVYAAFRDPAGSSQVFYGSAKTKTLYAQNIVGGSADGDAWALRTWAPRLGDFHDASLARLADGTYKRDCWGQDDAGLTELTGDKARAVLDGYAFMTTARVHIPYLLARDDAGIYYYVDQLSQEYGGHGFRVFIGKRGALKQAALSDVASDSGGDVFSTKTGDIRIVAENVDGSFHRRASYVRGDKHLDLVVLDVSANLRLIFKDLGIYDFLGTLCDNV